MKRIVSLFIVFTVASVMLTFGAGALGYQIDNLYTNSYSSSLTVSGDSATCKSKLNGYSGVTTKIVITQSLQKKSSGSWSTVKTSSTTIFNFAGTLKKTYSGLSKGTYRVKSVFTVYSGSDYETLTKYSSSKTI